MKTRIIRLLLAIITIYLLTKVPGRILIAVLRVSFPLFIAFSILFLWQRVMKRLRGTKK